MKKIRLEYDAEDIKIDYGDVKAYVELVNEEIDHFNAMSNDEKKDYIRSVGNIKFERFSVEEIAIDFNSANSERIYEEEGSDCDYDYDE